MQLELTNFTCLDQTLAVREAPKLRGYFADKYTEIVEMHHHTESGFLYDYPKVQYKVIKGRPTIIGIGECAKLVRQLALQEDAIQIDNQILEMAQKHIETMQHELEVTTQVLYYKFETPYMALNQSNYKIYKTADFFEQEALLKKILIGNILSFAKAMGYFVEKEIKVQIQLKPIMVKYKNNEMLAFKGEFYTNINLPSYIGLGKSVSRGFGTIKQIR